MDPTISQSNKEKIGSFILNPRTLLVLWILLAVIAAVSKYHRGSFNNYLIFKHSFYHALNHLPLYIAYPQEYFDSSHYGPFFSLFFAPFALLPDLAGMLLWNVANALFLFYALKSLPLSPLQTGALILLVSNELLTALLGFQFNPSIAAIIIFSFSLIQRKQNFWAACLILLGTFIKLYGIVGLAFFFFVQEKPKFIAYCILWAVIFFVLPMAFFSPDYIIQAYRDWYASLMDKQLQNASPLSGQDICVMGMARRIFHAPNLPNLPFLIAGLIGFGLPYLRISRYKSLHFRLYLLASTLLFAVIFSNSSESPTYIIAFCGVAIWYLLQKEPRQQVWPIVLLVFALLVTSFSTSDLMPRFIWNLYIFPYALKALPCFVIWLVLSVQLLRKPFPTT